MALPGPESDYATFRKTVIWFRVEEYLRRILYPSYIAVGRNIWFSEVEQVKDLADGVYEAILQLDLSEKSVIMYVRLKLLIFG